MLQPTALAGSSAMWWWVRPPPPPDSADAASDALRGTLSRLSPSAAPRRWRMTVAPLANGAFAAWGALAGTTFARPEPAAADEDAVRDDDRTVVMRNSETGSSMMEMGRGGREMLIRAGALNPTAPPVVISGTDYPIGSNALVRVGSMRRSAISPVTGKPELVEICEIRWTPLLPTPSAATMPVGAEGARQAARLATEQERGIEELAEKLNLPKARTRVALSMRGSQELLDLPAPTGRDREEVMWALRTALHLYGLSSVLWAVPAATSSGQPGSGSRTLSGAAASRGRTLSVPGP